MELFQQMAVISVRLSDRAQALPEKIQSPRGRLSILSQLPGTLRSTLDPWRKPVSWQWMGLL